MSRLRRLPIPVPFADADSYPAGSDPWSGQPTKVSGYDRLITPGLHYPSQAMNEHLNDRDCWIQELQELTAFASLDFRDAVLMSALAGVISGTDRVYKAAWDPRFRRWIIACGNEGSPDVITGYAAETTAGTFSELSGYSASSEVRVDALLVTSNGVIFAAEADDNSETGTRWISIATFSTNDIPTSVGYVYGTSNRPMTECAEIIGSTILAAHHGDSSSIVARISAGTAVNTWSNVTGLHSTFAHINVTGVTSVKGHAGALFFPRSFSGTVGGSPRYVKTTDGSTFTSHLCPNVVDAAGNVGVSMAAYNDRRGAYLVGCPDGSDIIFFESYDGETWTELGTLTTNLATTSGLLPAGGSWALVGYGQDGSGNSATRVFVTHGETPEATWKELSHRYPGGAASAGGSGNPAGVASNGNQSMIWGTTQMRFGSVNGFPR